MSPEQLAAFLRAMADELSLKPDMGWHNAFDLENFKPVEAL